MAFLQSSGNQVVGQGSDPERETCGRPSLDLPQEAERRIRYSIPSEYKPVSDKLNCPNSTVTSREQLWMTYFWRRSTYHPMRYFDFFRLSPDLSSTRSV